MNKSTYTLQQEDYTAIVIIEDGEVVEYQGRKEDQESCEEHALWLWRNEQETLREQSVEHYINQKNEQFRD